MSNIEIGSVWLNRATDLLVTVDAVDDMRVYYSISGKQWNPLIGWFTKMFDETDIEIRHGRKEDSQNKAAEILGEAIETMIERGKSYDKDGNGAERSMDKIVAMFNALTGHELTAAQGYKFMCCLKLARSEQGEHKDDNYLDGSAYFALAGEAASEAIDD